MKIGIDARMWSEAGNGRYIRNLVLNLAKIDQKNDYFIFLLNKDLGQKLPPNFKEVEADFRWYTFAEQTLLLKKINSLNLDLMHFTHFNIPILYRKKFVVTIHDITHQKFKMKRATTRNALVYGLKHNAYNLTFATALKKSLKILTPSGYVKDELVEVWKIKPEKIVVTLEAAEENFAKLAEKMKEGNAEKVLDKFNIKVPYIFYIGNAHPHKNVEGLIRAFEILRKKYQYMSLVLSGKDSYFWSRIREEFRHKDIVYTGFVTDEEATSLLKSAKVYVQPSFEEGFGIPLLEAFTVGTAVASSNAASLPEVGGDACVYFNPKDSEDMAEKIMEVLNDEKLRKSLIEKGKKRAKLFSFKKMAEETLKVYKSV